MYVIALLLLGIAASVVVGSAYVLQAHPDSSAAGFLAAHLPGPVTRFLLRSALKVRDWFDAGENPRPAGKAPRPVPVDWMGNDAQGSRPAGPTVPRESLVRPAAPAAPPPAAGVGVPDNGRSGGPLPVLEGVIIPPDHATVHLRIAEFEPETDADLLTFYAGEAAAAVGAAAAWEAHAEMLACALGLDPAFTHVAAQLAETMSEASHDFAIVGQRLSQVYGQVQQAVAEGLVLPYGAREWISGEV